MSDLLTYAAIMGDRDKFRSAATSSLDFNNLDTPGLKYFKIFFYFKNGDSDSSIGQLEDSGGLLAPTWDVPGINDKNYYMYNSAWSYLKMNNEDERAEDLKHFINLLSNISSKSPWYFTEVSGLDAAIERKTVMDKDFKIDEARPKISIKCLPDAFDDRIGTLLDLYRTIVWSWIHKREVLPANLRKFDMGIFVFETPNAPFHKKRKSSLINIDQLNNYEYAELYDGSNYKTSYKYFEFHNCEIDYGSSKGNFSSISNADGLSPEYTIDIHYDDCYEMRYNEMMLKSLGDFIEWDINVLASHPEEEVSENVENKDETKKEKEEKPRKDAKLVERISFYDAGFASNAVSQIAGVATDAAKGAVNKLLLGNLFTYSLSKMVDQANSLASGDVWSTTRNVVEYVNDAKHRKENNTRVNLFGRVEEKKVDSNGVPINNISTSNELEEKQATPNNMFEKPKEVEDDTQLGKMFEDPKPDILIQPGNMFPQQKKIIPRIKKLGNLATSNTIANNI